GGDVEAGGKIERPGRGKRGPLQERVRCYGNLVMAGSGRVEVIPEEICVWIDICTLRAVTDISKTVISGIRGQPVEESISVEAVKSNRDAFSGEGGNGGVRTCVEF